MYAVIRRYEGTDDTRHDELFREAEEGFAPSLSDTPGFLGYYFIDAGEGTVASVGIFETEEAAEASTHAAADYIRDQRMQDILPNPPHVTAGEVRVQKAKTGAPA